MFSQIHKAEMEQLEMAHAEKLQKVEHEYKQLQKKLTHANSQIDELKQVGILFVII